MFLFCTIPGVMETPSIIVLLLILLILLIFSIRFSMVFVFFFHITWSEQIVANRRLDLYKGSSHLEYFSLHCAKALSDTSGCHSTFRVTSGLFINAQTSWQKARLVPSVQSWSNSCGWQPLFGDKQPLLCLSTHEMIAGVTSQQGSSRSWELYVPCGRRLRSRLPHWNTRLINKSVFIKA